MAGGPGGLARTHYDEAVWRGNRDGRIYPPERKVLHVRVRSPRRSVQGELCMLEIRIAVDRPSGEAIGIKEDLAVYLEKFGDARVVEIKETAPEQLKLK